MPPQERELRDRLCVMLRLFYAKDWVSGTGGGISGQRDDGMLLVAPTGVHKELVEPDDLFAIDPSTCDVVQAPLNSSLQPSECSSIFSAIVRLKGAGSVVHSHALSSVLAGDLSKDGVLRIRGLEMLKGIRGASNSDVHEISVIENTSRESELTDAIERACKDRRFDRAAAILVKDHGAYIWGSDVMEAKRHAEVYHFLFEAVRERNI
ncbi:MAG: methylthioribulose 1-phosphate dehydratase [Actinomycetota bacterium]